jgi:hypothetical protein
MPATWLRSLDDVKRIQDERKVEQQQQQQLEAAEQAAKAAKLGSTKPEEGSPTAEAMEQLG